MQTLASKIEAIEITESITICRDRKDDKFLEVAVNGKADYLITGDRDLLVLHPFRNIQIPNPSRFSGTLMRYFNICDDLANC